MWGIDPIIIQWLCIAGVSVCAFMIGYNYSNHKQEEIINDTVVYLINNNYIRAKHVNGEWEIIALDDN
jgi:hypothetical protein